MGQAERSRWILSSSRITIRDAKSSSANNRLDSSVNVPTCALETCCAGPATTNSKGIEQEHLERPENLDISSAFLKPLDSETTYMHTFVCDERISFDGFRPRQSELRSSALESKQSVLRQLDPCIKCLEGSTSAKFCVRGVRAWCSSVVFERSARISIMSLTSNGTSLSEVVEQQTTHSISLRFLTLNIHILNITTRYERARTQVPSIDRNDVRHGFCMQSGHTCGPGYEKLTSVDQCPSPPDTRLDTETLAGPNYSGWIVLYRGNDVYYVYFVCEDALMPHSYTSRKCHERLCCVRRRRNINRRSRFTITEDMVTRVLGERENKREVDGSHYLSLLKQNADQDRDREIPKIFAKYLEQYEYARKKNQECRPIVRIDPFMRKKGSSTDETAWHDFFSKHGLPSQEKTSTCIGHTGDSELIGHATGRCFWIKLNGLWGDKIAFDDAESTEVRAVAIGLPPDADTSTPEKLKQLKKTQIENLDKVTVAVIEQIRKEHPDGVGGEINLKVRGLFVMKDVGLIANRAIESDR